MKASNQLSLVWGEPTFDELLRAEIEVQLDLFGEVSVKLRATPEGVNPPKQFPDEIHQTTSCCLNDSRNCTHDALKLGGLHLQLLSARLRKGVIARSAIAGGDAPLGINPAFQEHEL